MNTLDILAATEKRLSDAQETIGKLRAQLVSAQETNHQLSDALEVVRVQRDTAQAESESRRISLLELEQKHNREWKRAEIAEEECERLCEVLKIYADKDNWQTSAHSERETGEFPDVDGNSRTVDVEFETGLPIVWNYDDDGSRLATAALAARPTKETK